MLLGEQNKIDVIHHLSKKNWCDSLISSHVNVPQKKIMSKKLEAVGWLYKYNNKVGVVLLTPTWLVEDIHEW